MVVENLVKNEVSIKILKNTNNFSFSEICQALEVNGVSVSISSSNIENIEAIVKVDLKDLTSALRLLRQYEYEVTSNHEEDDFFNELKDRSKYLDKYLNI